MPRCSPTCGEKGERRRKTRDRSSRLFCAESITLISQPREPKLDATEGEIISGFLTGVGNSKPQLVGFSSHSSDLPALIQRALVNRLNLPGFCARPNKPWEGPDYFARGSDYNIDLKEELAGWGKATPSLHEVATACGIPGKIGTDGGDVVGLWRAGDVRKIVQYNECDALTTYLLWLRVALLAGHLTQEQHEVGEHEIRTLLEARSAGGVNGHSLPGGLGFPQKGLEVFPQLWHRTEISMFEQAFKNIDDILRKEAGCTTELDYTEQTSWLLFLKYLDGLEQDRAMEARLDGKKYTFILDKPYRWESWAAPKGRDGKLDHNTALGGDDLRDFVNQKLFPYLHGFTQKATGPNTIEYKIGQIFGEIKNKIQSGYNLREIIDHIDELRFRSQTEKHELSHLYEAKIKNMGNAGRNGGEYYTPRPLIRAIVQVVQPRIGERIYDGAVGSAGFLCESFEFLKSRGKLTTKDLTTLQTRTFYGKEKKSLAYVIAIMNMILHGIEAPNILHVNTLSENLADIQEKDRYDVVLGRQGAQGSAAELPHPHRRNGFSLPPALHQDSQGRWTGRRGHQEHVPLQHRQCLREPSQAPAGELQPACRA
jgi:hypothetical protein